jgi:hypothetical protein
MHRLYGSAPGPCSWGSGKRTGRFLGYNTQTYKLIAYHLNLGIGLRQSLFVINYGFASRLHGPRAERRGDLRPLIGGPGRVRRGGRHGHHGHQLPAKYITRWEMFLGATLLVIAFGFQKVSWATSAGWWTGE